MSIGNISGATAEDRGIWFLLLDANGNALTGAAVATTVKLHRGGVTTSGTGIVSEPDAANAPGLYLYDPAVAERTTRRGVLLVSHASQVSPAPKWPFMLVDGDVTKAPPTDAEVASAVRTNLTTELARIDVASSTLATPAQVLTQASAALATYDAPTKAELDAAAAPLATAATLATAQTGITAIQAKTNLIPASPAAIGSAMTLDLTQLVATGITLGDVLTGKVDIALDDATGTYTIKDKSGVTTAVTGTFARNVRGGLISLDASTA